MKLLTGIPYIEDLNIVKETEDMVLFEPFLLSNPKTNSNDFPEFDELYYLSLELQLKHLIYKFEKGWITSERQVMLATDECISTVHFIFDNEKNVTGINVFQRSSNLFNIEEDIQFFNYFIEQFIGTEVDLNIMFSMPHIFKDRIVKIEH